MMEENAIAGCVLLAEQHHALMEGIRSLLQTVFQKVFLVSDADSLVEGAVKLQPDLIVADLALAAGNLPALVRRLRECAPQSKLIMISMHEHYVVARSVSATGADGLVAKRSIGTELLPAVEAVLAGNHYWPRATLQHS